MWYHDFCIRRTPTCAGQAAEDVVDLQVVGGRGAVEDVERATQAQAQLLHQQELPALL